MNETFALFIDKTTLREFLAKRVSAEEFTNRAKFTLFDGEDPVGRVPIEVWEDSFNSTYKATNSSPRKGPSAPNDRGPLRACPAPFLTPGLTPPGGSASIKFTR